MASRAFVGREHELAVVGDALDRLVRNRGCSIVVAGEAGIGKSRFAREIAALAETRDVEVVWSAGWPAGGAPAYWPWPQILTAVEPTAAAALEALPSEVDRERFDWFRDAAQVIWMRAARSPLVLVVDDAHTIDADGLLLTRYVAQEIASHGVLLLITQRTGPGVSPTIADLLGEIARVGTTCRLHEFTAAEVADFIERNGERADADVVQRVAELTGGVPFLVEQALEAGLHRGPGPIPDPARSAVEAQLRELDAAEQDVIEAAAVFGSRFVPSELGVVAGRTTGMVIAACRHAVGVGLLRPGGTTGFAFSHELAREAIVSVLPPTRLAALHHRCVVLPGAPRSPDRANWRARHALERARWSDDHLADSVAIVRDCAQVLRNHGAPEVAVELLQACVELSDRAPSGPVAPLLVELGDALLATGRLGAARDVFGRAVGEATDASDPTTLARAALGLGGVWVLEHRAPEAWQAYLDVLDRASEAIASDASSEGAALRAALGVRIAAERAAVGAAEIDDVATAFARVCAEGDAHDVIAGLSIVHHLMLGPQHARERIAVADDLVARARVSGDDLHLVMGLLWRATDESLVGGDADRALAELRTRADALGMRAILFVLDAFDVMRQLRTGDLVGGEAAALACHARGVEVGDADADTYLAAQLLAINWYRGTAGDLLGLAEEMTSSTSTPTNNPVFTAAVAAIAAEAGDSDAVTRALVALGRGRLAEMQQGSTWLATMFCVVEAAHRLRDVELATEAYELLRPYESLPIMAAIGVACFGSTARSLGLAAEIIGRLDDAVAHLERAVDENQRLGNRPMTAIARADLAATLLTRHRAGDRERASTLVARAVHGATQLGLTGRIEPWSELQRRIEADEPGGCPATLERRDGGWWIAATGEQARVPHTTGIGYLARLLAAPGVDISVGQLVGLDLVSPPQALLDERARQELRRRITDLGSGLDDAARRGDAEAARRMQSELDELTAYLRVSVDPGGRPRRFDDQTERARTSVQKAIRRAIVAIGRECPRLAESLGPSVKTGYLCRYQPTAGAPGRWAVRAH